LYLLALVNALLTIMNKQGMAVFLLTNIVILQDVNKTGLEALPV